MSESLLKPGQIGHAAAGKIMISDGTRFVLTDPSGGSLYELPIVGPIAGISGAAYLAITQPVVMVAAHTASVYFRFVWRAGDSGVDALWRLRNVTTSTTLLSGSRAAPFSWTLEGSNAAVTMPAAGDEVALEVAFSAVAMGGTIDMRGPAAWGVS